MYRRKTRMRNADLRWKYFWQNSWIWPLFLKKTDFFWLFGFSHWTYEAGTGTNPSDDHISVILAARRSKSVRSSSDWPSDQPGINDFVFGRHHSELFRGTKQMKNQNSQIGLNFSNLANSVSRSRKKLGKRKKIFFLGWKNFFNFFKSSIYRIVLTETNPQHKLTIVGWRMNRASSQTGIAGGW